MWAGRHQTASSIDGTGADTTRDPAASLGRRTGTRIGTPGHKQTGRTGWSAAAPPPSTTLRSPIGATGRTAGEILVDGQERRGRGQGLIYVEMVAGAIKIWLGDYSRGTRGAARTRGILGNVVGGGFEAGGNRGRRNRVFVGTQREKRRYPLG